MAVTVARLQAVLSADTDHFDKGMKQSESRMKSIGKVAGLAGAAVAGGIAVGLAKSVGAAKDAQQAQIRLETALKNSNVSYKAHGAEIDAAIQKTSKLAALDDEDLSDAFAKLIQQTGSVTKATQGMNIAADIARARHISLEAATKLVEKANLGSAAAFKRVGLVVPAVTEAQDALKAKVRELKAQMEGATDAQEANIKAQIAELSLSVPRAKEQDRQATALKTLTEAQKTFGGAAETYGKSAEGASERFGVALENLEEQIGKAFLPVLTKLSIWGAQFLEWSTANWPRFQKIVTDAFQRIKPTIQDVIDIATSLKNNIVQHWDTINQVTKPLQIAIETTMKNIRDALQLVIALLKGDWGQAWDEAKQLVGNVITGIKGIMSAQVDNLKLLASALGRAILNGFKEGITGLAGLVWDGVRGINDRLVAGQETVKGWGLSAGGWIKDGIMSGLSSLGLAVWGALKDIPTFLKDKLGDIAGWGADIGNAIKDAIVDALTGLGKAIKDKIQDEVKSLPGKVAGAVTGGLIGGTGPFNAGDFIPPGNIGPTTDSGGGGNFAAGPASLNSSLWDEYALARSSIANWQDLGTYNPASLLPSGAPSDHAVYPAKAFDAGFSPATGWNNPSARAFFMKMIGRPGIHYAILGDKIWSAEQGLHSYGYGGHDNHVHVSSFDKGGWLQPGLTIAYNGLGVPERVGNDMGTNIYVTVGGSYVGEKQIEDVVVDAIRRARNKGRPV